MIDSESLFGAAWEQLDRGDVEAFLAHGEPEPLFWEAKGTKLESGEVRKQICGFGNSHEGGFLILGARWDKEAERWIPEGVEFPDEPPTWVSNQANEVRPRPYIDTRSWPTEG